MAEFTGPVRTQHAGEDDESDPDTAAIGSRTDRSRSWLGVDGRLVNLLRAGFMHGPRHTVAAAHWSHSSHSKSCDSARPKGRHEY